MKKVLWPVFVCLLSAVLVLSSCTRRAPEVPAKTGTETTTDAPAPLAPEPETPVTTVPPSTLISIEVGPAYPSKLRPGLKQQFKAIGTYSDGTIKDISAQVTWNSSDESIAVISASGEASGVARVSLPAATQPLAKTVSPPLGTPPGGGTRPPPPGAGSPTPLISLTAEVTVTATLTGITSAPVTLTVTKAPPRDLPSLDAIKRGMHFADWNPYDEPQYGFYMPLGTDQSLVNLAATGANWISLVVTRSQETITSTEISYASRPHATDAELRRVIDLAHGLGMRVMLWPGLGLSNDPGHWWGQIGTAFTSEAQWQDWFASYRESINHYATFAQEAGVDMLSIGIELGGVTHREDDWRRVVREVRERFKGPITYSSLGSASGSVTFPHGEDKRIAWWDAVDYIGVTYFDLTDRNDPTVVEIKAAWTNRGHIALFENLSKKFNKPILFTEIGFESADGANRWPGWMGRGAPLDLQEQADSYQATLEVLWDKPWFAGIFWWQWFAETYTGGMKDTTSTPWGKPAEEVLKRFYLSQ